MAAPCPGRLSVEEEETLRRLRDNLRDSTGVRRTEALNEIKNMAGSLEAFADAQGGSSFCRCTAPSAGYFLLIAKKPC